MFVTLQDAVDSDVSTLHTYGVQFGLLVSTVTLETGVITIGTPFLLITKLERL